VTNTAAALSQEDLDDPPFAISIVTDALRLFGKAARAHQLYLANNPMHLRAMDAVREAFLVLWKQTDTLELNIAESDFRWCGWPVLEEPGRTSDSLPWLFYKDGVRQLTLMPGFEEHELTILLRLIQQARLATPDDDDLLTLLWGEEFSCVQYKFVELGAEVGAPLPQYQPDIGGMFESPLELESGGSTEVLSSSSVVRMDDYDSTLYFLEDAEVDYLQREIRADFNSDLRSRVVASLLDTYEQETDPTVRAEITGALEDLFLASLSLMQFGAAAYMIREAEVSAHRAENMLDSEKERLLALADQLSRDEPLQQLLNALEHTPLRPPQSDLYELFAQLRVTALGSVLARIGRTRNAELRVLLESAASRMAASHTAELVSLIGSEDDVIAFEAIRRAGAMKASAAVPALAGALGPGPSDMRLAALNSLSQIASAGAMQAIERLLGEEDNDLRIAAVRALAARGYAAAAPRIAVQLRTRELRESSLADKMAFFESYGTLCGDSGVPFLDGILNGRTFLRKREAPELRACAAIALGKTGTPLAMQALQRAAGDGEIIVRNAVSRALRGG
jgi:hypothetical protein